MQINSSKPSHDYSRWIEKVKAYYPLSYPPTSYFYNNRYYEYITRLADGRRTERVLEVGTGSGLALVCVRLSQPWKERVVGVDVSREVIAFAKERCKGLNIELYVADARNLPFDGEEFDVCGSEGLLEHWNEEERVQMLKEMKRVAKRLVIDLPVNYRYAIPIGGYGDEQILPLSYWRGLFERCGLRIYEEFFREKRGERIIRAGWVLE